MNSWFEERSIIHQQFINRGLKMTDEPGVDYACHAIGDALYQISELASQGKDVVRRVYNGMWDLAPLKDDNLILAASIAWKEPKKFFVNCDKLVDAVTRSIFLERASEKHNEFVRDLFHLLSEEPVTNWRDSAMKLQAKVKESDLDLELTWADAVVALVIVSALIVGVYYYYFIPGRKSRGSEEFSLISEHFVKEAWAEELLDVGAPDEWRLEDAWREISLEPSLREQALRDLATLTFGAAVNPKQGDYFADDLMKAHAGQVSGDFVWSCECPGLRWRGKMLEKATVTLAEAEYLAIMRSDERGREIYLRKVQQRKPRPLQQSDILDPGILEDVFDVLGGDLETFDLWLKSLIDNCPNYGLAPACEDFNTEYVEQRMATRTSVTVKARAKVSKRLHRGLVRKANGKPATVLLRALVDAIDDIPEDLTELL